MEIRRLGTCNIEVAKPLCERLIAAYESFAAELACKDPGGLHYVDGLMAAHNFYKAIILDLERRVDEAGAPDLRNVVRRVAVDTLIEGLGLSPYYARKT